MVTYGYLKIFVHSGVLESIPGSLFLDLCVYLKESSSIMGIR